MLEHNVNWCGLDWTGGNTLAWGRVTDLWMVMHTLLEDKGSSPDRGQISSSPGPSTASPPLIHGKKSSGPAEGTAYETWECVLYVRSCCSLTFLHCLLLWSQLQRARELLDPWDQESKPLKGYVASSIRYRGLLSSGPSSSQSLARLGLSRRVFLCSVILLIC